MDTSSELEIRSVLRIGMKSILKVNTQMVLSRQMYVKLEQRMLGAGSGTRVSFWPEPHAARLPRSLSQLKEHLYVQ